MRYVVIPQWQGSASDRAMLLADGAEAIAGDLPSSATIRIEVPLEAGDSEDTGILRFSSLRLVREHLARELTAEEGAVVVIGGDCSVSYPAIARAAARDEQVAVIWFDAHPCALDIATSATGAFSGMVTRALVEDGVIPAPRILLAGARAWEDAEQEWVAASAVRNVPAGDLATALATELALAGASSVYIHVGLDVLDPSVIGSVTSAEPFGLELEDLSAAVRSILADYPLAGATISGFAPRSAEEAADELPTVLRLLAALRPPAGS